MAIQVAIYHNAQFTPQNSQSYLTTIFIIASKNSCICYCYTDSSCLTATFVGNNQTCTLYSTDLSEGQIQFMPNMNANVISFLNRTRIQIPNPPSIIEWLFDGNVNDVYVRYNGYLNGNNMALYISPGYNGDGQAVYFPSKNYSMVNHYLNLTNTSFTFSAWIWIPSNGTTNHTGYFLLIVHCEFSQTDKCLHLGVVNGKLFLGFYGDDLKGNSNLKLNQWYHVAYVYDRSVSNRSLYFNGNLDRYSAPQNPYTGNASNLTLGATPAFSNTFNSGYVDKLIFVSRIKYASELLEEATLVAYYSFDNTYADSGPNQINNSTGVNTYFSSTGKLHQAMAIDGSPGNLSYYQATGFYFLGQSNYSFSFSMWIYPFNNSGTILQVISSDDLCTSMIDFTNASILAIQIPSSNGMCGVLFNNGSIILNIWTHLGMTYSNRNGIRLFVNGSLVSVNSNCTDYQINGSFSTITVGFSFQEYLCSNSSMGTIYQPQFHGKIDELKIFCRELSPQEVYQLSLL